MRVFTGRKRKSVTRLAKLTVFMFMFGFVLFDISIGVFV